ncbi:MAG: hypothetical protein FWG25_08735, partial [Promicromonosporaceae bacterium]|nr:hypothetical protein [Promicromonosporaceae bacterium]
MKLSRTEYDATERKRRGGSRRAKARWKQTVTGLVTTLALTAAACSPAGANDAEPTPAPDQGVVQDQVTTPTQSTRPAEDPADVIDEPMDEPMDLPVTDADMVVGASLRPGQVKNARAKLADMDADERAGRVVIGRPDGTFSMSTFEGLNSDDRIADEDVFASQTSNAFRGIRVFNGQNVVENPWQGISEAQLSDRIALWTGEASRSEDPV